MIIKLFIAMFLTALTTPSWATSLVISEAVIDWSGFSYTISEGLTVTEFSQRQSPFIVAATYGGPKEATVHFGDGFVSSSSESLNSASSASVVNGVLTSRSTADGLGKSLSVVSTHTSVRLDGSGQGVLTVSAPYSLHVSVSEPGQSAIAFAAFFSGSAVIKQLIWDSPFAGELTENGVLTVSRTFDEPFFGPLTIAAIVRTHTNGMTFNDLPEPSSLWLFACGVVGLLVARRYGPGPSH